MQKFAACASLLWNVVASASGYCGEWGLGESSGVGGIRRAFNLTGFFVVWWKTNLEKTELFDIQIVNLHIQFWFVRILVARGLLSSIYMHVC